MRGARSTDLEPEIDRSRRGQPALPALPVLPAAPAAVSARSRSATRLAKLSIVFTCLQEVHDVNVVAQG